MKPPKLGSFAERQAHSAEAKKALVAKFKPKPTVVDPEFEERRLARQIELEELRAQRATEREAKREEFGQEAGRTPGARGRDRRGDGTRARAPNKRPPATPGTRQGSSAASKTALPHNGEGQTAQGSG